KDEVFEKIAYFKKLVETQMERRIKVLQTDNGTEYVTNKLRKLLRNSGTRHQLTVPYTPEQNGVAERMNRTIVERAKCMLHDAQLSKDYWAEAVNMATYLINRTVNTHCPEKTPEEIWSGKKIDLSDLKVFGSPVMVHIPKEKRKKWDYKSSKQIFVGYDSQSKGYRCIDPVNKKLQIARDVIIMEKHDIHQIIMDSVREVETQTHNNEMLELKTEPEVTTIDQTVDTSDDEEITTAEQTVDNADDEYEPDETVVKIQRSPYKTRAKSKSSYSYNSLNYACFVQPENVEEALHSEDSENWKLAMQDEIKSHEINNTWSLVKLPPNRKAIKTKWVFKVKQNEKGEVERYKARLVAKGYGQRYGIEYTETYSPVVRYVSIRYLIALAVQKGYNIHQMDVTTAFLQGDIEEEIFMEQPEGYHDGSNKVCRLNRSIYGLKQAGRQWNLKLDSRLKTYGLNKSKCDPCIYYSNDQSIIIAIYVDDFLIFHNNQDKLSQLKKFLSENFQMKDLGEAKYCLGLNITQKKGSFEIDQIKYVNEILKRFGMEDCKPIGTPRDVNQKFKPATDDTMIKDVPYQEAIGSLLYLAQATRPDIAFAVNDLSRYNLKHNTSHWQGVKRIIRYLKGTSQYKLKYTNEDIDDMCAFSDADWASQEEDRRSCTGFIIKMAGGAIRWGSKRQPVVALSSTEAEYIALSATVREIIWLKNFANEINSKCSNPSVVHCDNQSAIKLGMCDGFRPRTKHIDTRYHHIREQIQSKNIEVRYISTKLMSADSLTKPVTK
ncbi:MAG TPA: hypothetical protein DDZ41_05345, partial [Flavobacterium sp.]|nr:hypothetical protein [Flavobacterium sp.]